MRKDNIKIDYTIRQNGVRLAKGKNTSVADAINKISATAEKKIHGVVNKQLFGGIVTSITCFGLFYQIIACMGA